MEFVKTLAGLKRRWTNIFKGFADKIAPEFVDQTDKAATSATLHSLSLAGVNQPRATYNAAVENTLQAATTFNNTLIVGISEDVHEKLYTGIMLSLTSPNPEEQGGPGIARALKEVGGFADNRINLIARDHPFPNFTVRLVMIEWQKTA